MGLLDKPTYRRCGKFAINVCTDQTEGQCRDEHNCDDGNCPLAHEFANGYQEPLFSLLISATRNGSAGK